MKIRLIILCLTVSGFFANAQKPSHYENRPDFFPIAVWAQDPSQAAAYKENGINMFISIHNGLDETKLNQLRNAKMKVICHQNNFGLTQLNEPLIYGWMHGDEPDNAQASKTEKGKYDPCRDPAIIISDYEKIKKNDPSRPVYINLGRGVAATNWVGRGVCRGKTEMYKVSNNGYLRGCDIASFDIYPVNSREEEIEGNLWYVAKGIDNLREWSNHEKPVWCWIETTNISDSRQVSARDRKPTPSEVKSEVWMALVHGAKGFGYFCHSFVPPMDPAALLHDREMIAAVKKINEQVTALAPVLNSENTNGYATVQSGNSAIPVDIMTKKLGKDNYIFAVAMRNGATNATFKVNSGKRVEVLGENRSIKIKNGKFTDDFAGFGVHLYKISS